MHDLKRELYVLCQDYLNKRIQAARETIDAAQRAANSESKSSSGDKYETGRAMMQLEVEKHMVQLSASVKLRQSLDRMQGERTSQVVAPGSLVITDCGSIFFLAISLGKVSHRDHVCFVVSPASPIGKKLIGLRSGDTLTFQDQVCVIREIV